MAAPDPKRTWAGALCAPRQLGANCDQIQYNEIRGRKGAGMKGNTSKTVYVLASFLVAVSVGAVAAPLAPHPDESWECRFPKYKNGQGIRYLLHQPYLFERVIPEFGAGLPLDLQIDSPDAIVASWATGAVNVSASYPFPIPNIGLKSLQIERKSGKALLSFTGLYSQYQEHYFGECQIASKESARKLEAGTIPDTPQGAIEKGAPDIVGNKETAAAIARAILVPIYGEAKVRSWEPFAISYVAGNWTVVGTARCEDGKRECAANHGFYLRLVASDGEVQVLSSTQTTKDGKQFEYVQHASP